MLITAITVSALLLVSISLFSIQVKSASTPVVSIVGYDLYSIADSLIEYEGEFVTSGGTLESVVVDNNLETFALSYDFGSYLKLGFSDPIINGTNEDLALFELGFVDTFSVTINGIKNVYIPTETGEFTDNPVYGINVALINLDDFNISSNATVDEVIIGFDEPGDFGAPPALGLAGSLHPSQPNSGGGSNSLPTLANISKSVTQNSILTFSSADFNGGYSDTDTSDPDSLVSIRITNLPGQGTLKLGGTNVTLNQEITSASIPSLTYTPNNNYTGTDVFGWNATDGTGYASTGALVNLTISGGGNNNGSCTSGNSGTNTAAVTTTCLTVSAGILSIYAGDSNPNHDICTPGNISAGDTIDTTIAGQASATVLCTNLENSIALSGLSVSSTRQSTTSTIHDIIFEDLRGLSASNYTVTATVSNFTVPNTQKSIVLGSNPDGLTLDTDIDKPTNQGDQNKIFANLNPSIGNIEILRPGSAILEGITNYQRGQSTSVVDTTTPITLLSTTQTVTPGRVELSDVDFKLRVPSFVEQGNYQGVIVQTVV